MEVTELTNTITELKTIIEGFNSRLDKAEERIPGTHTIRAAKRKNTQRSEDSLRNLWDTIKQTNICVTGPQKEREQGPKNIFEGKKWLKIPKLKETHIQIQEA